MTTAFPDELGAWAGPGAMSGDFADLSDRAGDDPLARGVLLTLAGASGAARELLVAAAAERPAEAGPALAWAALAAEEQVGTLPGGSPVKDRRLTDRLPVDQRPDALRASADRSLTPAVAHTFPVRLARQTLPNTYLALGLVESELQTAHIRLSTRVITPMRSHVSTKLHNSYHLSSAFEDVERACLARLAAGVALARGGTGEADEWLSLAQTSSRRHADHAGIAATHVLHGAALIAPRTGPDRLDHWRVIGGIADTVSPRGPDPEELEQRARLAELEFARAEEFLRLTRKPLPRAWAMLHLRRAQLALIVGRHPDAVVLAKQAAKGFRRTADERNLRTALVHRAVAEIQDERTVGIEDIADDLADWANTRGSLSHALGLALAVTAAGHAAEHEGRYGAALGLHRLARETFRGLRLDDEALHSSVAIGRLHQRAGDLRTARSVFLTAEQELSTRPVTTDGTATSRTADRLRLLEAGWNTVQGLRDPGAAGGLADRLDRLLHDPNSDLPTRVRRNAERLLIDWRVIVSAQRAMTAQRQNRPDEAADALAEARAVLAGAHRAQRPLLRYLLSLAEGDHRTAQENLDPDRFEQRWRLDPSQPHFPWYARLGVRLLDTGHFRALRSDILDFTLLVLQAHARAWAEAEACAAELERRHGEQWWDRTSSPLEALGAAGEIAEHRRSPSAALTYYRTALERVEQIRSQLRGDELRTAFADSGIVPELYFRTARTLLRAAEEADGAGDRTAAAEYRDASFEASERGRARGLHDLLVPRAEDGTRLTLPDEVITWRRLSAQATLHLHRAGTEESPGAPGRAPEDRAHRQRLQEKADRTERRLVRLERQMTSESPGLWQSLHPAHEPPGAAEVRAALGEGTLGVAYSTRSDELLLWAFDRHSLLTVRHLTTEPKRIDRGVHATRRSFTDRAARPTGAPDDLADLLLSPIAAELADHERVVFLPAGPLHELPFAALPWRDGRLADHLTVSSVPSAGTLLRLPAARAAFTTALTVGDPPHVEDGTVTGALPWARIEALAVARHTPEAEILLEERATRKAVLARAEHAHVIHLAAHGELDRQVPLASAVLLAGEDRLTAADLVGLQLNDAIVVASACETGQGWLRPGEDVQGLTRGILAAGASAALVALWKVPDDVTAVLMDAFHRELADGADAPTALRRAQQEIRGHTPDSWASALHGLHAAAVEVARRHGLREPDLPPLRTIRPGGFEHPYFWAGFVCVARQ